MDDSLVYERSESFSLSKVFGWFGLGILVTFVVALGLFYLIPVLGITPDMYVGLTIGASILMIVETFVLNWRVIKNHKSAVGPFFVYAISMGILMSSIIMVADAKIILLSLGTTALVFGLLALFGWTSKKNLNSMGSIAAMTIMGTLIISLFNIFIGSSTLYWIISMVTFGAIMLFTAVDIWRIRRVVESGYGTSNLAIYCAFQLYIDFIYIFMRIIEIFLRNSNN